VAIASFAKPYSEKDMVDAVDYLFRHERGDESRPGPTHLEMSDDNAQGGLSAPA
jgi:hypothetical protein